MRTSRPHHFLRPRAMAAPVVRHDVVAVWPVVAGRQPIRKLHQGVAMPAEALLHFTRACSDAKGKPGMVVVLERVTTETLAVMEASGTVVMSHDANATSIQPPPSGEVRADPLPTMGDLGGALLRRIKRMLEPDHRNGAYWRKAYEDLVRQTGRDLNDGLGLDPRKNRGAHTASLTAEITRMALFKIAAFHQGGSSRPGEVIAEALGVSHPMTMPELERAAIAEGFRPLSLWPWRGTAGCTDADVAALAADKGEACSSCGMFAAFGHNQHCPFAGGDD